MLEKLVALGGTEKGTRLNGINLILCLVLQAFP